MKHSDNFSPSSIAGQLSLELWLTLWPQEWSICKFSSQFRWNVSQRGIENEDCYQLNRCDLDITQNSHDYPTKDSMVLVGTINVSIMGKKSRLSSQESAIAQCYKIRTNILVIIMFINVLSLINQIAVSCPFTYRQWLLPTLKKQETPFFVKLPLKP